MADLPSEVLGEALLAIDGLVLRREGVRALDDLSLRVRAGVVTGLVGAPDAGASALLDILSDLARPDAGSIRLGGVEVAESRPHERIRAGIARAFDPPRLMPRTPLAEIVALGSRDPKADGLARGLVSRRRRRHGSLALARHALADLGLGDRADLAASDLDPGEAWLVGLARALASDPLLLLLDAPPPAGSSAFDSAWRELDHRIEVDGLTVLLAAGGDLDAAAVRCDDVIALVGGRAIAQGRAAAMADDPAVRAALASG